MAYRETAKEGDFHLQHGHRAFLFYEECANRSELYDFLADAGVSIRELRFDRYAEKSALRKALIQRTKGVHVIVTIINCSNCVSMMSLLTEQFPLYRRVPIVVASPDGHCLESARTSYADGPIIFAEDTAAVRLGHTVVGLLNMEPLDPSL